MGTIPRPLLEAPTVPEHLEPYIEAFWLLSAGRPVGFGPSGIPTADILAMWQIMPLGDAFEFVQLVRQMDRVYIDHHAAKLAANS